MAKIIIAVDATKYLDEAMSLIASNPATGDLPQVPLLLFIHPAESQYVWYPLAEGENLEQVVAHAIERKRFIPVGITIIKFEKRSNGRIYMMDNPPAYVDSQFDEAEVLRSTVPYFMRDEFGYDLSTVKVTELFYNPKAVGNA